MDRGHASGLRPAAGRTALQHWGRAHIRISSVIRHIAKAVDKNFSPGPFEGTGCAVDCEPVTAA